MTLIRKPDQIQIESKIKVLIYGQPGVGKTTMAISAPRPLLLDCDGGLKRINPAHICDAVQVSSYDDVLNVLNEDLSAYDSLIVDTGGKLLDFMALYIIARNPKMGKANGALTLQGYGERKSEFVQFCKRVNMLGKHIIFVAHRETRTEGDDTRYVPQFGGSSYDTLVTELDVVGYLEMNGNKATITFNPTSRNDGKNTCNLPPMIDVPVVVDANGNGFPNTFFTDVVIKSYNAHLKRFSEIAQSYNKVVGVIKENIQNITDDVSANDFVSRIDSFEHVGASKEVARCLLASKTKELNLKWNSNDKRYEYVEPAA